MSFIAYGLYMPPKAHKMRILSKAHSVDALSRHSVGIFKKINLAFYFAFASRFTTCLRMVY